MTRAAGLLVGLAVLAAVTAARADPPGFPSTTAPPTPPTAPATAPSLDEVARTRIAALKKFVRDKESDPMFAQHEGAERACRIDRDRHLVTLTFNADGTLHCKLTELAEGYQVEIWILTVKDVFSTGNHYRVSVAPGAPLKAAPVRGTSNDVKAVLEMLGSAHLADYTEAAWWRAPTLYGPYHVETGTITIALDEAAVSEDTKLSIAPLYLLDLAVVGVVGPGLSSFTLVDGKIFEGRNRADLAYYFGVHAYPLSWNRNGNRSLRPGRYFSDDYSGWNDRLSLVVGVNLAHPTEGGFVGGALELYGGISLVGGWQPRKSRRLQSGHMVGEMVMGTDLPTDEVWNLSGWGVGVAVDATLLRPLLAALGR